MTTSIRTFAKTHAWLLRIGLITAAVIIGFQVINQLVLYSYLKLDYYLSLVAITFLSAGLLIRRPARTEPQQNRPANNSEITQATESTRKEFSTSAQVAQALIGQIVVGTLLTLIFGLFLRTKNK